MITPSSAMPDATMAICRGVASHVSLTDCRVGEERLVPLRLRADCKRAWKVRCKHETEDDSSVGRSVAERRNRTPPPRSARFCGA